MFWNSKVKSLESFLLPPGSKLCFSRAVRNKLSPSFTCIFKPEKQSNNYSVLRLSSSQGTRPQTLFLAYTQPPPALFLVCSPAPALVLARIWPQGPGSGAVPASPTRKLLPLPQHSSQFCSSPLFHLLPSTPCFYGVSPRLEITPFLFLPGILFIKHIFSPKHLTVPVAYSTLFHLTGTTLLYQVSPFVHLSVLWRGRFPILKSGLSVSSRSPVHSWH